MENVNLTWLCLAICFFVIGMSNSKTYLILALSFLVFAFTDKKEDENK